MDVNRNPRRWVDESGRMRVIEGWHPSEPTRVGYNVKLDGDWLGTFHTLDGAVTAATTYAGLTDGEVVLRPCRGHGSQGGELGQTALRLVPPAADGA